jgi:predicted nucleic acid-binding protein
MTDEIVVVDASLVIKAILPNPEFARCQAALAQLQNRRLVAPALWVYEITSTLAKAVHFGQLTASEGRLALHQAMSLGVQVILPDETQARLAFDQTLHLKRAAAYDSFYLATAQALEADFWTADQRLVNSFQGKKPTWLHALDEVITL